MRYIVLIIFVSLTLFGCQKVQLNSQNANDSYRFINSYTPESTYQKYFRQYPSIAIPSLDIPEGVNPAFTETYKRGNHRPLELDWFLPSEMHSQTFTLALIHGGGWGAGAKENMHALAIRLAKQGVAAVAINYRLSHEARYPAAVTDIKDALVFIQKQARVYGLNEHRVAIAGGSAGGQLAALVGVTGNEVLSPCCHEKLLPLAAIVNIDGLMDFTDPDALKHENDPAKQPSAAGAWFGGRFEDVPDLWIQASPNRHLSQNTPPMLFIRSSVPRFSIGYKAAMEQLAGLGTPVEAVTFDDAPHSFWLFDPWVDKTAVLIERFLMSVSQRDASN